MKKYSVNFRVLDYLLFKLLLCLFFSLMLGILCISNVEAAMQISSIEVNGTKRVSTNSVVESCGLKIGEKYTSAVSDFCLKRLYGLGFFEKVKCSFDEKKKKFSIDVKEHPVLNQVLISGNSKVGYKQISKVLSLKSGDVYSLSAINRDTKTIIALYGSMGFYAVHVEPRIIRLSDSRVNIIYNIKENHKAPIGNIAFEGNSEISSDVLLGVIVSREKALYRLFSASVFYDPARIANDEERLRDYYHSMGYYDFRVVNTVVRLDQERGSFAITFIVDEGKRYRMKSIGIMLDNAVIQQNFKEDDLKKKLAVKEGDVFNKKLLELSAVRLKTYLGRYGYAFARVKYDVVAKDEDACSMDVVFKVTEGLKAYVNKINIVNNSRTLDKVIRRNILLSEGDAFNLGKLKASERKISNLNYFSEASIDLKETNVPDKVDLEVGVKEKPTGALALSVGYNNSDGFIGSFLVSEDNILGTGYSGFFEFQRSSEEVDSSIGFVNPYFNDRPLALGFDFFYGNSGMKAFDVESEVKVDKEKISRIFNRCKLDSSHWGPLSWKESSAPCVRQDIFDFLNKEKDSSKDKKNVADKPHASKLHRQKVGGVLHMRYLLRENLSHSMRYLLQYENLSDLKSGISPIISASEGRFFTSAIGHKLGYSTQDNDIQPTAGYSLSLDQLLAGIGGDFKYIKNSVTAFYHQNLLSSSGDVVLHFKLKAGNIQSMGGQALNINNHVSIDGKQIRGFDDYGIGPRALSGESLGGKNFYHGTVELNFPLGLPKELDIKGALFFDFGSLFSVDVPKNLQKSNSGVNAECKAERIKDCPKGSLYIDSNKLRSSYGAGIIFNTPIGVKISLDYAWVLSKADFDKERRWRVSFNKEF